MTDLATRRPEVIYMPFFTMATFDGNQKRSLV